MASKSLNWKELYFSYKGRISVKQLWLLWLLPKGAVALIISLIDRVVNVNIPILNLGILETILILLTMWTDMAIMNKRMHDRNHGGWYPVILLIPLFLQIAYYLFTLGRMPARFSLWDILPWLPLMWFFIEYALLPGNKSENRYGKAGN